MRAGPVEIGPSVGVVAVNVAALRRVEQLPHDLVVGIPAQRLPGSVVKLDKLGESLSERPAPVRRHPCVHF
jgi:hypothetical protein